MQNLPWTDFFKTYKIEIEKCHRLSMRIFFYFKWSQGMIDFV